MSLHLSSPFSHLASSAPVIGRFAPSPTGPLHVGSLVAAVGSYLLAKREGGKWLLRMEDLDAPRVVPGMADDILRTLEAFGLHWDEDIVWQSRRTDAYIAALEQLAAGGHVYHCGCSRAEIARAASAPHPGEEGLVYPGTCRPGLPEGKERRSVRLRVPDEDILFTDGIMGPRHENLARSCGDFIIRRADGPFAYQLAVVVDDAEAGITQVARGVDLLDSTPRQILIQRLLGFTTPIYWHLPLVTGSGGAKLSKRDNAVSLAASGDLAVTAPLLLVRTLLFLGQTVPPDLHHQKCKDILRWSIIHFDPTAVPTGPGPFTEVLPR